MLGIALTLSISLFNLIRMSILFRLLALVSVIIEDTSININVRNVINNVSFFTRLRFMYNKYMFTPHID